ncbi:MAG: FliA/WhiG family RNA polymerase sigma factor [Gemmatimonadetes bacterium]|nr:FliA/WhiG family RNA polymerase sigma factor [Gemmatimonadota bacterium]NNM32010.1 FliA/WhiG family RNA polymerase sigma factor [Gemmatimonadota bacterium]
MDQEALWRGYREKGDMSAREQLLLRNLPLVHHVARQVRRRSRVDTEYDELVSAGTIGLIQAIDNFDIDRGLAFSTYAAPRIRGAILDDHRRRDRVPRSIRRKQREIANAHEELTEQLGRTPNDQETAESLGIETERLWQWQRETEHAVRVSLDKPVDTDAGRHTTPEEMLVGEKGEEIENMVTTEQEVRILRKAITQLKKRERTVLSLYYFENLKLREIGQVLNVTESRVSQIHSQAIGNLREALEELAD